MDKDCNVKERDDNQQRAYFDDLPDELLLHIFTCLQNSGTRAPLCLVSRRLNRIMTSILYETYVTKIDQCTNLFMRTIIQHSDLAKHVKYLDWCYVADRMDPFQLSTEAADMLDSYKEDFASDAAVVARGCGPPSERADALLTVALMQAPNIINIRINLFDECLEHPTLHKRRWFEPICRSIPHEFQRLQSADILMASMRIREIACLMNVPSLRHLRLDGVVIESKESWDLMPATSSIRSLILEHCQSSSQDACSIIAACKALLSLSCKEHRILHGNYAHGIQSLKAALDLHIETLQTLHFKISNRRDNDRRDIIADIGSFSHYSALRGLSINVMHIPFESVWNLVQRIPLGLCSLRLVDCMNLFMTSVDFGWLKVLAKDVTISEGQLKTLYIPDLINCFMSRRAWEHLRESCASHGLELEHWKENVDPWDFRPHSDDHL